MNSNSNTFDPFADLNTPATSQSSSGAVRRASAQASLDNNIFFGAPQAPAPAAAPSSHDPFAAMGAAPAPAPARSAAPQSAPHDPFASLGSLNNSLPQAGHARPAQPAPAPAQPSWGAPVSAPSAPADPFASMMAPAPAHAPAPVARQEDPFGAGFDAFAPAVSAPQSSSGAVRRASAQASLDNNIFFGAPQAPAPAAAPSSHDPFAAMGAAPASAPARSAAPQSAPHDPFAAPAPAQPAPIAHDDFFTPPAPAAPSAAAGQFDPFAPPASAVGSDPFATSFAAPPAPQPAPVVEDDPFAAFGSKPAPAPVPPAPAAQSGDAWGSDDPFGSFPAGPRPAPIAAANDWGLGDDDFFSPPAAKPAGPAATERGSFQSPAHRNASENPEEADDAMKRFRELYPTDGDVDFDAPEARESHRPAGGRYGSDNKSQQKGDNNLPTEGSILARLSTRSLFVKDWAEAYWVIQNNRLLLFRNKSDYEYNPGGTRVKKEVVISPKLRLQKVHVKEYSGVGNLYNFMLEEMEDFGPVNVAKFASRDRAAVDVLYVQLTMKIAKAARASGQR